MTPIILYISLIVIAYGSSSSLASEKQFCQISREMEANCSRYTYEALKPLLVYMRQISEEINKSDAKDKEIKELQNKLIQEQGNMLINNELRAQIAFQQATIDRLIERINATTGENCDNCKSELADNTVKFKANENQLRLVNEKLAENAAKLQQCELQVIKHAQKVPNSCVAFGESAGAHQIQIPGLDAFDVLCDREIAGPGWLVIEQRFNGRESFNRDWATFRKGIGSFAGDYFLGLEKIHRLTTDQFNELYIHMERFDGSVDYARYEHFVVGNETDKYRISFLGDFSGNVRDNLRPLLNMKFTTEDSDNDLWMEGNCANYRQAFLHGKFHDHETTDYSSIYFNYPHTIKKLIMMIRPAFKK
ncbi:angiopoietin-related protein 7-like isoform X2 [Drosophila nasuta]|uniref:angiopoietin-related protein 7-like isoform X2 n=1 Tax=Drosophila nasuta TaxID=42062 RepID=UPI00295E9CEA|nr:angiopoietin-related protein 7-like isoform X2 [Drosophila nasuta]